MLFEVLFLGEHALHGFTNRDLRQKLAPTSYPLASEVVKRPGQATSLLRRLHAYSLVAKIPHSRRRRTSLAGRRIPRAHPPAPQSVPRSPPGAHGGHQSCIRKVLLREKTYLLRFA